MDGIPARCEEGLLGHISAYMGIVEPQMRLTEHIHMLVHVLGFSSPRQLFDSGGFVNMFRRVWSYFASVCFTSQEAFAVHLRCPEAMGALREAPLMPVTRKQRHALGEHRAEACLRAQKEARGVAHDSVPLDTLGATVFHRWTPSRYRDIGMSASEWARLAALDANAGSRQSMNHVCLPKTCNKGRWAKIGFCRMFFWHWAQRVSKKTGKMVMARVHGHALQERWTARDLPPVQQVPPQAGMPGLERNHAYHCKMLPGIFLGARCNHDVSPLLRFPVLSAELKSAVFTLPSECNTSEESHTDAHRAITDIVNTMTQLIVDHEYYASDYSAKSQPHAANLLQTLHDGLLRHSRFAAEREASGQDSHDSAKAQRLLQSLICATNHRLHKGMPSIYAYLLGKPSHYCSHSFEHWSMQQSYDLFCTLLPRTVSKDGFREKKEEKGADAFPDVRHWTARSFDYSFRPEAMDKFPVYYFLAGTTPKESSTSSTWDWHTAAECESDLFRYIRHARQGSADVEERRDHPCLRNGADGRLYVRSKRVKDELGKAVPLVRADGTAVIRADHYRQIRVSEPWKVPLLFGANVHAPNPEDSIEAKGRYALKVFILFRPWRAPVQALHEWLGGASSFAGKDIEDVFGVLHTNVEAWQSKLATLAAPHMSRDPQAWQPPPVYNSDAWWACLITKGLNNLRLVSSKHTEHPLRPATVNGLPVEQDSDPDGDDPEKPPCSDVSSEGNIERVVEDLISETEDHPPHGYPAAPVKRCGTLPLGTVAIDLLSQPTASTGRSAEAKYAREYKRVAAWGHRLPAESGLNRSVLPSVRLMCDLRVVSCFCALALEASWLWICVFQSTKLTSILR